MLNGNILDVYPDHKKNVMVTWLIDRDGAKKVEKKYEPSFYVYTNSADLYRLASILQDLPQVKSLNFSYKKITLGKEKKKLVLEVTPKKIVNLRKLADMIDSWGNYHRYQLFNVDLRLSSRYLQSNKVFCNGFVKWDGKKFLCKEEQWAIDYKFPSFKIARLNIEGEKKHKVTAFNSPISSIIFDNAFIEEENEIDTILSAVDYIKKIDPDIIYTFNGDDILLPFLYHRAEVCGIKNMVNLGRDMLQRFSPVKESKSYFSYGQIIYRPAFYTLSGRAHIDTSSSFMYGESGLRGLVDISRCSNIPLQMLSRLGPGTAISQMQVNKAVEKNYLVPWKKNMPEIWKTAVELLISDRGGLILDPAVGIHEDVIELDYASLYPNVMLKFNISPETMLCSCCRDSPIQVPQLGYNICVKQKGLLVEVLEPVIHRRFFYKARSKNKDYDKELYKELQQAWKWILLVCFGYTGYRNARYGRIECYESITAFSRDALIKAIEVVETSGYDVIHGIIDSLWIKPKNDCVKLFNLTRRIGNLTGVKMDIEGHYRWIVFLPSKQTGVGAPNRYYGVFDSDEIKVRGIELRQRNTPKFLKNIQHAMLKVLSKANNTEEFYKLIPAAIDVMQDYAKEIIRGNVDVNSLVFKTRISKGISEYKVNNLVKSALLQLRDIGIIVEPGQSVRYIVLNEDSRNYKERVCIVELITGEEKVDVDFYLRQIAKCGESMLVPFDYSIEKLETMLQKIKYRERLSVSILPRVRAY
jgi:DNA polymerase elongation subunit (family B)